ncbi:MAG: hypothetical protein AAF206_02140 [Bacteroidota bacterium]
MGAEILNGSCALLQSLQETDDSQSTFPGRDPQSGLVCPHKVRFPDKRSAIRDLCRCDACIPSPSAPSADPACQLLKSSI